MDNKNFNFQRPKATSLEYHSEPKSSGKRFFILIVILILFFGGISIYKKNYSQTTGINRKSTLERIPIIGSIAKLITNRDKGLIGENNNRINILLLGMGGQGHDGPLLTDTIVLLSIQMETKQIAMISIPRDLSVKIPKIGYHKINHANAFGTAQGYPGGGARLTADALEESLDIKIPYYILVDFNNFVEIIDDLSGIQVYVEQNFEDHQFPDKNYGVQTITFKQGWQKLNGERALQYSRSRHGTNGESSDYARAKRQQKILMAVRDKVMSFSTLLRPKMVVNLINDIQKSTRTNFQSWELIKLIDLGQEFSTSHIVNKVLDDSPEGYLRPIHNEEGAFLLVPKNGNFKEIQYFVDNIFVLGEIDKEESKVKIENGTSVENLALNNVGHLQFLNYKIIGYSNAKEQNYDKTVIYNFTKGEKPFSLDYLKTIYQAKIIDQPSSEVRGKNDPDFILILGKDYAIAKQIEEEQKNNRPVAH